MNESHGDLSRTVLAVLAIILLIGLSLWVLRPFLGAIVWAAMIVVSTWPVLRFVESRLCRGKRWLAVTAMVLSLFFVVVVPVSLGIGAVVSNAGAVAEWARSLTTKELPPLPEWIGRLPLVGAELARLWDQGAAELFKDLTQRAGPSLGGLSAWFLSELGGIGVAFIRILLIFALAAILYAKGEVAATALLRFGRRLAGPRGEQVTRLAGQAIRGVALGVVVTAIAQSVLGGIGLAIAGVPYAALLTAAMFLFGVAQVGAVPVLAPAIIWLYWSGYAGSGTFLLVLTVVVGTMDNVLRPFLIKKGADLPLLLTLAGVIGGLISFGVVGIFIGPVVLAVAYTLFQAWVEEGEGSPTAPGP